MQFYALYPEYASNPLWITGESYAGIYVPTLAHTIVESNNAGTTKIPLTGILVGNGCIGSQAGICANGQYATYGDYLQLSQYHGHGFVSDAAYAAANKACGNWTTRTSQCSAAANAAFDEVGSGIDVYDIYTGIWGVCNYLGAALPPSSGTKEPRPTHAPRRPIDPESGLARIMRLGGPANGCTTDSDLDTYLNTAAVQTALHVRAVRWNDCGGNGGFGYSHTMADERTTIYPDLVAAKIQIVIFNGEGANMGLVQRGHALLLHMMVGMR